MKYKMVKRVPQPLIVLSMPQQLRAWIVQLEVLCIV